jgi:hypothetical protein
MLIFEHELFMLKFHCRGTFGRYIVQMQHLESLNPVDHARNVLVYIQFLRSLTLMKKAFNFL